MYELATFEVLNVTCHVHKKLNLNFQKKRFPVDVFTNDAIVVWLLMLTKLPS